MNDLGWYSIFVDFLFNNVMPSLFISSRTISFLKFIICFETFCRINYVWLLTYPFCHFSCSYYIFPNNSCSTNYHHSCSFFCSLFRHLVKHFGANLLNTIKK